jgi:transposase
VKVEAYLCQIDDVDPDRIVYVDETGFDTCLDREYAYAPKGEVIFGRVSGRKYKRTSIVAAKMGEAILAPMQYNGTMDGSLFEIWFEQFLLPQLPEDTVIVMDNAAFHRKSRLFALARSSGHSLLFLPPYSPELNPIENFWGWLKRRLRKCLRRCDVFDDALFDCFQVL